MKIWVIEWWKTDHLAKNDVLFHQDNPPAHKSVIQMANINELKFELLSYALYLYDLAPLKKFIGCQRFANNQ